MAAIILNAAQTQAFSACLERLYAVTALPDFPRVLMEAVSSVIPAMLVSFDEVCLADNTVRSQFDRETWMTTEDFLARWAEFKDEHPGIAHVAAGGPKRVMTISDFTTRRQFRDTGLYSNVFRPFGAEAQLAAVIPVAGHVVGIALNREVDFTVGERQMLELLQPHIVRAYCNAQTFTALRQARSAPPDFLSWRRSGLTRRECEILRWVSEGKRDAEISVILGLSCRTVNHHVASVLQKLGVETRTSAATKALELLH